MKLTIGAGLTVGFLVLLQVASALGASVPGLVLPIAVWASTLLAASVAARNVLLLWSGPPIVPFDGREGVLCDVAEAAAIRSAAQARASTGGAGYVRRISLVFPAVTWAAIAVQSAAVLLGGEEAQAYWPVPVIALGAVLTVLFPPTAFCYVEQAGGCVLVHPPLVALRIVEAAGVPPALTRFNPKRSVKPVSHAPVTVRPTPDGVSVGERAPPAEVAIEEDGSLEVSAGGR